MKIVHVITAFGIGGAEKLLLNIINRQIIEHEVHLIYLKKVDDLLPNLDKKVSVKNINLSLATTLHLRAYFKEVCPDIIHTHLGHADILGVWSARNLKCKVFTTMHNIYFKRNFFDLIFFEIYKFLYLRVVKTAQIITISKSVENHVLSRLRVPKNRTHYLMNAIPYIEITKQKSSNEKRIKLLFVGRLEKQKSIETLLYAISQLKTKNLKKEFQLIIVGDGLLRNKLEQLSRKLQIESLVKFEGKKKEINEFYISSDIFILPSIWEGFGIVILEAFRARLPVIASNIEGPSELIEHRQNGLLFEPKNYIQLADQILLLMTDEALRKEIGEKGHETFTKKYHIDTYVNALNELYKDA